MPFSRSATRLYNSSSPRTNPTLTLNYWTETVPAAFHRRPAERGHIIAENAFGNIIFRDEDRTFRRICPEELSCEIIAETVEAYQQLLQDPEFLDDWRMTELVEAARSEYGHLAATRCFCLKIPAVLGGMYGIENISTIDRKELIAFSGDLAEQINDWEDGGGGAS